MSKKMKFKGFNCCEISEVYVVIKYKDGCIYDVKSVGYVFTKDITIKSGKLYKSDIPDTVLSSIPTSISIMDEVELEILTLEEIKKARDKVYELIDL